MGDAKQRFQVTFEYTVRFRAGGQALEQVLTPAGEQGWELCVLTPNPPNPTGLDAGDKLIFKRRRLQ